MPKKLIELYAPKPKGEKEFVAKHTIKVTKDKSPATTDDHFKANNVKTFQRRVYRFGYDIGDDEKAYGVGAKPGPTDQPDEVGIAPYTVKTNNEDLDEHLAKDASASAYIKDFVHSKNKKFGGDSKKERIKRALGAYYGKNESEGELSDDEVIETLFDILDDMVGKI